MDYKEIAYYIRKRLIEKNVDDVIVGAVNSNAVQAKFTNNKISIMQNWDSVDIGVFISLKKKIASTSIKDFSRDRIDKAIEELIRFVNKTKPNEEFIGIADGPFKYKKIEETYDPKWKDIDPIDFVEESINKALEIGAKRCSGLGEIEYGNTYLLTSGNVESKEEATCFDISIRALCDKYSSGHSYFTSRTFNKFDYLDAAEEAGTIAKDSLNPETGKSGKYDVVFSPLAFAPILNSVGSSASIFSVESGLSFFNNLINKKVASDNFNLYDDATLNGGIGSSSFDAEGYPSQRTLIIGDGVLKNFLHNTSTARRYKTKSTGNAGLISPDPRNLILEEGKYKKEELFNNLKNGLWITNVWYTRFQNYASGDFSTIPRDGIFLINNGEIVKSIKGTRISENMINMLKNVNMISNKAKDIVSWEAETPSRMPFVLVKNVNITKPEKEE